MIQKSKNNFSKTFQTIIQSKKFGKRILSAALTMLLSFQTFSGASVTVHAASDTITLTHGNNIYYGDYATNHMTFDGDNTAYCVEPMRKTPPEGSYEYELLSKDSDLRKALYYLPGGYGYDANIKNQYLSGWSSDNAYVIGHLTASYIQDGYTADNGAFYGAPQDYIDKAIEVADAITSLPVAPDTFKAFIVADITGYQTIAGSWYQQPGWIEIKKSSANSDITSGNANYSLKGAEYGIYKGDTLVETLVTNENGYAKSGELTPENYTIKELKNSKGYIIDSTSYKVAVTDATVTTQNVKEVPQSNPIDLLLQKLDQETNKNTTQGKATLAGAEFTVKFYAEQSDTNPANSGAKALRTWIFKTDANGKIQFTKDYFVSGDAFYYQTDGKTPCLPLGTVTIQETAAPNGYHLNNTVFVQKITANGTKESVSLYNTSNVPEKITRGGVKIQKRDLETQKAEAQANATLEKATFTITSLNENPVLVNGKSYTKDQVVATLTTNEAGTATTASDLLPYGHYRLDETVAPNGYLTEGQTSVEFDIKEDGVIVDLTSTDSSILDQIIRGDLEFVKVSDGDFKGLANVPFTITSKTTGESHTIVTDANGYASTSSAWNKHTHNTNQGKTAKDGIWFGSSEPDDYKGALPYDTYTLEEQRCTSNIGYELLKFDITIDQNSVTVDLGTLIDYKIEIRTTALDKDTGLHLSNPDKKVTLIDTVECSGLRKGQKYKLVGILMDQKTGEPLLIDGKQVIAETVFKTLDSSGTVDVIFTFDASSLKDKTIVVFEELYHEDLLCAVHTDINDEGQTIHFPEIKTSAKDADTNTNISYADNEVTLIDTVSFKNLIPGKKYELTGILMDKSTGKEIEINGKNVTSTASFTPETSSGIVDVTFTFDGSSLKGKTIVVFESLSYESKELAIHADISDEGQTIYFPEIETSAKDSDTETPLSSAAENVTLIDTVTFKNLIPGKEYTLTGTLMDKETSKPIEIDGAKVTSTVSFTPEVSYGSIDITFTFNGISMKGKTIVVFETLSYEGNMLAVHTDIHDEDQTIYFPEIGTSAKDAATEDHISYADETVTLVDTVTFKNLIPGKEYTLVGTLMNKESGEPLEINGEIMTATASFIPKSADGSVDVTFTFDGSSLKGKTIVAFESLSYESTELAVHADLEDENQTIYLPEIGTSAKDSVTQTNISYIDEKVTLIDTVTFENLIPGKEYSLTGTLMDKASGKPIEVNGEKVTSTASFTPKAAAGTVDISFTFNGSSLKGKTIVVFESLSYKGTKLAVHTDINDEGQTIYFPEIGTSAKDSITENHLSYANESVTLIDTVAFHNLIPGKEYTVIGILMDKESGEPILIDGKEITSETTFKAETTSGTVDVSFTFDGSSLKGKTIVAFESLIYEGTELTVHADINDEEQTIHFPEIKTSVNDSDTEEHISYADESVTLIDTVSFRNLIPGKEYTLIGTLMDKESGEPLEINGENVTSTASFTPEATDGTVDIIFIFDGSLLKGKTIVVFEELYHETLKLAVHTDINDEEQTIYFPEIETSASDSVTEDHISYATETVTLVDTVTFKNLIPGKEYILTGTLMDKVSGEPLEINGENVTAITSFCPEEATGTVEIFFTFDASSLKGKTIVVFESLSYEGKEVAVHTDLNDDEQTVLFPEIKTSVKDADTGDHISYADVTVTLIDTVAFKNLIPGKEYTLIGTLMSKETGEPLEINGENITSTVSFSPEFSDGTTDVIFTFDASYLKGQTIVVFESLSYEGKDLAVHTDINDEAQTICFPKIETTATDTKTGLNSALADEEVTIIDTVKYSNLIPGKEYHLIGTLIDKESGEALVIDGKPVTCETIFSPEQSNGSIDMVFTFNANVLKGKTIVAFEALIYEEKTIAIHADIEDPAQTICFPEIQTTAKDAADGDKEIVIGSKVTIIDTVSYKNLTPGMEYKIYGVLMDKATETEVLINGSPITVDFAFTPKESSGSVNVTFTFDTSTLDVREIVVFEKLFMFNGEIEIEIANHEDISDKEQTVKLISIPEPVKTGDDSSVALYAGIAAATLFLTFVSGFVCIKKRKISN